MYHFSPPVLSWFLLHAQRCPRFQRTQIIRINHKDHVLLCIKRIARELSNYRINPFVDYVLHVRKFKTKKVPRKSLRRNRSKFVTSVLTVHVTRSGQMEAIDAHLREIFGFAPVATRGSMFGTLVDGMLGDKWKSIERPPCQKTYL